MNILVIGGGGREHAIVQKLAASRSVKKIYCAPGNAGTADQAENVEIEADDLQSLLSFAKEKAINLTVVGPEKPLVMGIVDLFEQNGLVVFGPSEKAARIEGSKVFAKNLMTKYGISTARYDVFNGVESALKYIDSLEFPVVIKADGLAAGKGAVICKTRREAEITLDAMLVQRVFGNAGDNVIVEDFHEGVEISLLALVSGNEIMILPTVQDHKAVFDGDQGPNTGGMGAYSPYPFVTSLDANIIRGVMVQAVHALKREDSEFCGVLYAGLMITKRCPIVLEFNCRFGDPETQAILPRLKGDLGLLLHACATKKLDAAFDSVEWDPRFSVCVVMASGGYPGDFKKGLPITGALKPTDPDVFVYHAGTRKRRNEVVTSGGRVLGVTALGASLRDARAKAYAQIAKIEFENAHYRTDIGRRERKDTV